MNYYMGIKDIKFKKYGLKTTAIRSVFWPCYRLAISVETRDEIDPFAKVVLQMANCGITDTDELSEIMVIDREDILNIKEVCNDGDSATWQIRVISNRYQ